jgi:hypothetical protein
VLDHRAAHGSLAQSRHDFSSSCSGHFGTYSCDLSVWGSEKRGKRKEEKWKNEEQSQEKNRRYAFFVVTKTMARIRKSKNGEIISSTLETFESETMNKSHAKQK